jgi:putative membrane protein
MVDDHSKANDELKSVASGQNYQIPAETGATHKAMIKKLSKLSGDAFDKAYMKHMVADHKKDVAEFKKESTMGKNEAVKNFAAQTLPTLQEHLKQAQEISGKMGAGAGSSASAQPPQ